MGIRNLKPPWQIYGMIGMFIVGIILSKIENDPVVLYVSMIPIVLLAFSIALPKKEKEQ